MRSEGVVWPCGRLDFAETRYLVEGNRRGSVPCAAWRIAVRVTLSESWPPRHGGTMADGVS